MASDNNPALGSLVGLAGKWNMELSNASFLPNSSDIIKGHVSCEWLENGVFLVLRMGDRPSPPWAIWLISRDQERPGYSAFYYDDRQVSRIYEMSFADGVWKMWRDSPGFSQRYEGKLSRDGNTITAEWQRSQDGLNWEHDFDVKYTRVT